MNKRSQIATNAVNLDTQIREAVRDVMAAPDLKENDFARVQQLLDQKAASIRAPFSEKVRRIKAMA